MKVESNGLHLPAVTLPKVIGSSTGMFKTIVHLLVSWAGKT